MTELPCPNCGSELTFLDQYQRYYCHQCQRYAPDGYGAHGAMKCPTCGGILSYVAQYDRFYCFRCNAYANVDSTPPVVSGSVTVAEPAPKPEPAPEAKPAEPAAIPVVAAQENVPERAPETPAAEPAAEPSPQPAPEAARPAEPQPPAQPAPKETPPSPVPAAAPESAAKAEEPETGEASRAILALASSKPAVVRVKLFSLRKPDLMDLCKAYDLDPSGTKDQLQERLLSYLSDLEAEAQPEAEEPAPAARPAVETPVEEKPIVPAAPVVPRLPQSTVAPPTERAFEAPVHAAAESQSQAVVLQEFPTRAAAPKAIPIVVTPMPVEVQEVERPCPTCGRELNYMSQYGRWYCYFCQRYAPAAKSKNACPTCGATLRWIVQYERWWCDACRKYAPADLPRPSGTATVTEQPLIREAEKAADITVTSQATVSAHRHSNPSAGIGLMSFGIVLFVLEEILVEFPAVFGLNLGINVPAEYAIVVRFFAFFFVAVGAIVGLMAVRERA